MTPKILVLASNPQGTERIRIDQEIKKIKDLLRNASTKYLLETELAVRKDELQSIIVREKPRIIHFCGHGTHSQGLVLENDLGIPDYLQSEPLANLLKLYSDQIECVVFNVCYSEELAQAIHQHINYVIGTKREILDEAAIAFSKGFYGALGEEESIERAFELGCNQIQIEIYGDSKDTRKLIPIYSSKSNKIIDLPQHEVLKILVKKPPNQINDSDPVLSKPLPPSNSKPNNPFNNLAGRIDEPQLVFGREKEVNRIFEILNCGSSVAIIGEAEIGKSSLLRLVEHQAPIKLNSPRKPIYLNLGNVYDEEDFYFALCDLVGINLCKGFRLSRELKQHKLLLILDNVENMAWDGFTNQIRSQIRALAEGNDAPLRLAIAANKPLNRLFSDSSMVSPFENICLEEPISCWSEAIIDSFINYRLQNNPITFTREEIVRIIADSQGYPKQVMQLCYQTYSRYLK